VIQKAASATTEGPFRVTILVSGEYAKMKKEGSSKLATGRLQFLDGLRGLAALDVFFHHFALAFLPLAAAQSGLRTGWVPANQDRILLLLNGRLPVLIFFTLSGFVLAQSTANTKRSLPTRLVARYLRLTVPMTVSLVLAWCLLEIFFGTRTELHQISSQIWITAYTYSTNLPGVEEALKQGLYKTYLENKWSFFNSPVWTMQCELFGSIAIYLIYRFPQPFVRRTLLGLFILPGLVWPNYLGFPLGALLREMWTQKSLRESPVNWLVLPAGIGLLWCSSRFPFFRPCLDVFFALTAALSLYSALTIPQLQRVLSMRLPLFLGRVSFSFYLVHVPWMVTAGAWFYLHLALTFVPKLLLTGAAVLVSSLMLAWLMTIVVDEPLMKFLHRLKSLRHVS
jgi:peptidoglycan/LPS O-acetylase OafA/YrhL